VTVVDIGGADMAQWFRREFDRRGIPSYPTPERAVKALKSLIDYGIWLKREGIFEEFIEKWERPKAIMTAPVISRQ
jgi:acyl-CoA synthetase (NDP forming)